MLGKLLFRYLKKYRWLLLGVLVFQFIAAIASLYLPRLNADIIDQGVARGDTAYIWSTGMVMLTISLGQITASIIATYFAARAAMAACDVAALATRRFDELSGGEARRVIIAQALCQGAKPCNYTSAMK